MSSTSFPHQKLFFQKRSFENALMFFGVDQHLVEQPKHASPRVSVWNGWGSDRLGLGGCCRCVTTMSTQFTAVAHGVLDDFGKFVTEVPSGRARTMLLDSSFLFWAATWSATCSRHWWRTGRRWNEDWRQGVHRSLGSCQTRKSSSQQIFSMFVVPRLVQHVLRSAPLPALQTNAGLLNSVLKSWT